MATEIKSLQPAAVWSYFYELTQIPRPTFHCKEVGEYIYQEGLRLGLETHRDDIGNVIIRKPATPGMENKPVVTLQAHMDMVPQKNSDVNHNFESDPIEAHIDGEWVKAKGTTLGADNGIGVAYALAIMADKTLKHGPIEALITVDEEVGMDGANNLQPGFSRGNILLNIDSEVEGSLFVGCAGGVDVNVSLEYKDDCPVPNSDTGVKLSLKGLKGGHSGVDIHLGRANANKLMCRFLKEAIEFYGARLSWLDGGSLRNAIPREATAVITLPNEDVAGLWELVSDYQDLFRQEYKGIEDKISFTAERVECPEHLIPEEIQDALVNAVEACVNGPISMLHDFPGTVESSTNLAKIKAANGKIELCFLVRSSSESRKMWVASAIESAFRLGGFAVEFDAAYNGWQPNIESHALEVMKKSSAKIFGYEPNVLVMHAGLECGIIQGVMPDMDMISVGPEIRHPHSPDEKVHIESVERVWRVLVNALEQF